MPVETVNPDAPAPSPEPSETASPVATDTLVAEPTTPATNEQTPAPVAEVVAPPQIDEEQNIVLTGAVTEQSTDETTGASTIVTQQTTAEGHQVTTEYVTNPAVGQTTVRQTVTDTATGKQTITERTVPATTFKAGAAASITSAQHAQTPVESTSNTKAVAGWFTSLLALVLGAGAIFQYRRAKKSV